MPKDYQGNPLARAERDPTTEELYSPPFNALWGIIKEWDIKAGGREFYTYGQGNHVVALLDALHASGLRVVSAPVAPPERLTASEAVFAFIAWLTTSDEAVTLGRSNDCAPLPPLIDQWCTANGLAEPREDFHRRIVHPPHHASV